MRGGKFARIGFCCPQHDAGLGARDAGPSGAVRWACMEYIIFTVRRARSLAISVGSGRSNDAQPSH